MKHKARTKALSWLLSLALVLSLVPAMSLTASAAVTWSESFPTDGGTISGGVTVSADITLTIPEGKTLTVNGGINAEGKTLTVEGAGTLVVNGKNGSTGTVNGFWDPDNNTGGKGGTGGIGGIGFTGNLVVNGATVTVSGGNGGTGGNAYLDSGTGSVPGYGGNGGNGGVGVVGNVTVNSGSVTAIGGIGGNGAGGSYGSGTPGTAGKAVEGAITGKAQESDDNSAWTDISSGTSTKQYVKVESAHTHNFTYEASGATITATCSANGCTLPDAKATLTIKPPANLVYDGKAKAATVEGEIPDVTTPDIMYEGRNGTTYEKSTTAPTEKGDYTASVTLGGQTASVDFTIKDASYTIIIPATLTVANAGWNATAGITASGEIAEGTKLTVTAASANEWKLKDGENTVDYYLATEEGGEPATVWDFSVDELAAENGTNKSMGAVVEEYINKPAGDYADTVTFTAEVKSLLNSITIGGVNSTELIYADGDTWAQIVDRNPGKIYIHGTQIWRGQDIALFVGSTPVNINEPINPSATYKFEAD